MLHNKKLIISLVVIILLAAVSFAFMSGCGKSDSVPASETQQEAIVPTPLVIETPKEQTGSISCYDMESGELIQQYVGPITVTRRNGQYVISYESSSCTCFSHENDIEE
ncbi:MAG: hypothetical protein PHS82_03120 [Lachnospiraceae bacterium]|nr:hypothetical protein [Lachnospiraceae bacterium]